MGKAKDVLEKFYRIMVWPWHKLGLVVPSVVDLPNLRWSLAKHHHHHHPPSVSLMAVTRAPPMELFRSWRWSRLMSRRTSRLGLQRRRRPSRNTTPSRAR